MTSGVRDLDMDKRDGASEPVEMADTFHSRANKVSTPLQGPSPHLSTIGPPPSRFLTAAVAIVVLSSGVQEAWVR
jgi:hypothetical protein